jgi:hypothetical protein
MVPLLPGWSTFDISSGHRFPKGWKPRLLTLPGGHTRGANPANPGGSDSFTRDLVPPDALWLLQSLANRLERLTGVYGRRTLFAGGSQVRRQTITHRRRSASPKKKPLREDLGLTGQHRAHTNDDYKPSLRGSYVCAKSRVSIRQPQISTGSFEMQPVQKKP